MCKTIVSIVSRSVCIGNGKTLRRIEELDLELFLTLSDQSAVLAQPAVQAMQRRVPRRRVGWSREPAPALELSALLLLPQDCLTAVLAALPPRALATCCGASRSLRQAASDPKLWAAHCRDQWPEDEEPSPSRLQYGKRSRLFAGLTICGTHLSPSAKLVAEAALTLTLTLTLTPDPNPYPQS